MDWKRHKFFREMSSNFRLNQWWHEWMICYLVSIFASDWLAQLLHSFRPSEFEARTGFAILQSGTFFFHQKMQATTSGMTQFCCNKSCLQQRCDSFYGPSLPARFQILLEISSWPIRSRGRKMSDKVSKRMTGVKCHRSLKSRPRTTSRFLNIEYGFPGDTRRVNRV